MHDDDPSIAPLCFGRWKSKIRDMKMLKPLFLQLCCKWFYSEGRYACCASHFLFDNL